MDTMEPIVAVAFSALCIWLGMRVFNRREPWAVAAGAALLLVVGLLGIGSILALIDRYYWSQIQ
jgi:hypothetical protein